MLKNYLFVAVRHLWKNKAFSAINIIGLSVGLAVCLLIVLYVKDELGYDRYIAQSDKIYRLDADISFNGTQFTATHCPAPLAPTLKKDYPQIVQYVRLRDFQDILIKKDYQNIQDHNAVFADSTFFQVFSIPMIAGNPVTALNEPNSIVINETTARKYFNSTDVVGKTLFVDDNMNCKITGVFKDIPSQSHFHFNFIRPMRDTHHDHQDDWLSNNYSSYVLVSPGVTQASFQKAVDVTISNYLTKQLEDVLHTTEDDVKKGGNHFLYPVMPLNDIHLFSNKSNEFETNGNITYVYIFSVIAFLILLIACVNFMNLSTAQSSNRAKEVGIRKVAGSSRSNLITQFLAESTLLSFISLLIALDVTWLLLPLFNQLAGKQMTTVILFSSWMLPILIALILIVGCLAGSYSAFYLSSFQPVQVLKSSIAKGLKSSWLRNGLVIFQFVISISLILGTIVIYNQINYMRNKEIGYNRDQVLVISNTYLLGNQTKTFREEISKISGVQSSAVAGSLPTETGFNQSGWFKNPTLDAKQVTIMTSFYGDQNYIPTLGMRIAARYNLSILNIPQDDTNTMFYFIAWSEKEGIDQEEWRRFCGAQVGVDLDTDFHRIRTFANNYLQDRVAMKSGSHTGIQGIPNQDIAMWETMGPIADRSHERLGASDIAIVQFRRIMVDAARKVRDGGPAIGTSPQRVAHVKLRSFEGIVPKSTRWTTLAVAAEELALRQEPSTT